MGEKQKKIKFPSGHPSKY